MAFDWLSFLNRNNIEIGRSRRNEVEIHCPFCGPADPSYHLGISLEGKGYHCWRDESHSGIAPHRLISALLGISPSQAVNIVKQADVPIRTTDEMFTDTMFQRLGMRLQRIIDSRPTKLELLPEFKDISDLGMSRRLILPYLAERQYTTKGALRLAKRFNLKYATSGQFSHRVIIPVYMNGKLQTWTSRTVADDELRYRTLSHDPEKAAKSGLPAALMNIKECIFDYDNLANGGDTLVITEGPFDAMRITFLGEKYGILGTCLFSKSALPLQISLIESLANRYKRVVDILDSEVRWGGFDLFGIDPDRGHDHTINSQPLELPSGVDDPADLSRADFEKVFGLRS